MTRLEDVENGAMMSIDTLCTQSYSSLAQQIIDYQKQYYHEIYNAELVDHYFINNGIDVENPTTWEVAVSVFKNPNDEYIVSVCNYGASSFTKSWLDDNSGRTIEITSLAQKSWTTILINRTEDDLVIDYSTSATTIALGDVISVNISVEDYTGAPVNLVKIELIIGTQTFVTLTDSQGNASFTISPITTGTLTAEIVAIKDGYDYGRATFALTIQVLGIPGFNFPFLIIGLVGLIFVIPKKRRK